MCCVHNICAYGHLCNISGIFSLGIQGTVTIASFFIINFLSFSTIAHKLCWNEFRAGLNNKNQSKRVHSYALQKRYDTMTSDHKLNCTCKHRGAASFKLYRKTILFKNARTHSYLPLYLHTFTVLKKAEEIVLMIQSDFPCNINHRIIYLGTYYMRSSKLWQNYRIYFRHLSSFKDVKC